MASKKNILWVTDGTGWGWDIRANYISSLLTEYCHHIINARGRSPDVVVEAIAQIQPAIVVVFAPSLVPVIPCPERVVMCLPGTRMLISENSDACKKRI